MSLNDARDINWVIQSIIGEYASDVCLNTDSVDWVDAKAWELTQFTGAYVTFAQVHSAMEEFHKRLYEMMREYQHKMQK